MEVPGREEVVTQYNRLMAVGRHHTPQHLGLSSHPGREEETVGLHVMGVCSN